MQSPAPKIFLFFPPPPIPGYLIQCHVNCHLISVVEDIFWYRVHMGLTLERRLSGRRGGCWFWRTLEHAGFRCLQQATITRRSPINCANCLFASDVAYGSTDQHLCLLCSSRYTVD